MCCIHLYYIGTIITLLYKQNIKLWNTRLLCSHVAYPVFEMEWQEFKILSTIIHSGNVKTNVLPPIKGPPE